MPMVPFIADAGAGPLYRHVAGPFPYLLGYNPEATSLPLESTTQWPGIHLVSQPGSAGEGYVEFRSQVQGGGTNLASTSANTIEGYRPDPQVQRDFQHFLVTNRYFLQSLPDSTPCSIARVKQAFEQNVHQYSLAFNHGASDLDIIMQQFKAEVATPAVRRECDLKKKDVTSMGKFLCPFRFCDGHFTRGTALRNHLGAHFRLKPCRCSRCGNYYSDTAFDRHVDGCKA
ncbi:hypothetical protein BDN70DRAFT_996385 [Pholiota conissans]|uniref:C2H2-type domain-containing protein n=1 Tax=Pholiota conissans TaxID=109636 RepID=A0A9P5YTG7_9AGAR|nr:hypothetical protein BDN70DRAFT_996385 [Pholiota conissans]